MPKITSDRLAVLICIYFIAVGIHYSIHTPIFEGPDELAHFVYTDRLLKDRALPVIGDRETVFSSRHYEIHQMPLYYMVGTLFIAPFDRADAENYYYINPFASIGTVTGNNEHTILHPLEHTGDTVYAVWSLRMMSLMMGTLTLLTVYHSGRQVWDDRLGLGAMFLLASMPMFIHVSSVVNNDNLNNTLCALAVFLSLRNWNRQEIRPRDMGYMAIVLGLIAMTKLTGLSAFGFVIGAHLLGAIIGRFSWRQVGLLFGAIALSVAVLSGWYYVRNWILYQDLIAYSPTAAVWARWRGGEANLPSTFELWGVWESFWMSLGHLNVPGPVWLIRYMTVVSGISLVGVGVTFVKQPELRWRIAYISIVTLIVWASMAYITRRVNVSQGRALYPGIAATAPLLVLGLRGLFGKNGFVVPILPLAIMSIVVPFTALDDKFEWLEPIADVDNVAMNHLDARAETIMVHGYNLRSPIVNPDGEIILDVYFEGGNPENPVLFVTAQDPINGERLGKLDEYPGMTMTSTLPPDQPYRTTMQFSLNDAPENKRPFQIELALGWRIPEEDDPGAGRYLDWFNQSDDQIGGVFFPGPVYIDPTYEPPMMDQSADVVFSDMIALRGYTVVMQDDQASVQLLWERVAPIADDWTLTVGVLDEDGELIAQDDRPPAGYPTSVWQDSLPFVTEHVLTLPDDSSLEAVNQLRVGWYSPDDFERLTASGSVTIQDNLVLLALD